MINGTVFCGKKSPEFSQKDGGSWLTVDRPGDTDSEICKRDQGLC